MLLLLFLLNINIAVNRQIEDFLRGTDIVFVLILGKKLRKLQGYEVNWRKKVLFTFVAHSTYCHWYVYWFTVWSLVHSLSSSLDPLAIISLLIHPHAHSLILSYLVHLTFLVIINYTEEEGEWTVVHIDSVLCLSSHYQKPLATTSILSCLMCHSMNIISGTVLCSLIPVIYCRDLLGPWFSSFWDNLCGTYVCFGYIRFSAQVHRYGRCICCS